MELTINGQRRTLADGTTVAALLQHLGLQPERVVVEVNLQIIKRDQRQAAVLRAGDVVEIVQFVGGGMRLIPLEEIG